MMVLLELVFSAVSIGVGIFVALKQDVVSGLAAGICTFAAAQFLGVVIFDIFSVLPLPDSNGASCGRLSEEETIERLRNELESEKKLR